MSSKKVDSGKRPDVKAGAFWWSGSAREVNIYIAGYQSGCMNGCCKTIVCQRSP